MKRMLASVIVVCLFASSAILAAEKKADKKVEKKSEKKVEQKAEKKAEKKPEPKAAKVKKSKAGKSSKWSLSAGVRSREMDVEFSADAPAAYANWASLVRRPRNTGSTSVYNGEEFRVEYENGAVFTDPRYSVPSSPLYDGTVRFGIDSADQIGMRDLYYTATFGSTRTRQWSELSQTALDADDDANEGGVYVAARRRFADDGLGVLVQYGVNVMETASDWQETARQTIMERQSTYATTYDVDMWALPLPAAPFESRTEWLVFDAGQYNATYPMLPDAMDPRQAQSSRQRTLAVLSASSKCDLDADIHDLLLGLEWEFPLGDWFSLSVAAGPTLNVIAWDMERTTQWANETTGDVLQTLREDASDEEVEVGAAAQLTARLSLDKNKRFFCEGSVAYNWLDKVKVKTDSATAEINASSVSAALGFGVGF
ncbi:MAG: hypothetical protein AB7T27_08580 [Kiritimatiellia bacterium]